MVQGEQWGCSEDILCLSVLQPRNDINNVLPLRTTQTYSFERINDHGVKDSQALIL